MNLPKQGWMGYKTSVLALGSCFATNIASKLVEDRFDVIVNPLGILYNPISIANLVLGNVQEHQQSVLQVPAGWKSYQAHGSISNSTKEALEVEINQHKIDARQKLETGVTCLVTFGSAWVHTLAKQVVANCHKQPGQLFEKQLLDVETIVAHWQEIIESFPATRFVFTVSPVRYKRDGWHESNLSKAVLHLAINRLVSTASNAFYFPAYEIVLDELRDYRFYDRDLVHPNSLAIDYVYDRFAEVMFDERTDEMLTEWKRLKPLMNHRILEETDASRKLVDQREEAFIAFKNKYFSE